MKRVYKLIMLAALILALVPTAYAQGFTLVSPNGSTLVRNLNVDFSTLSWTPLSTATSYTLSVFKVSNNPRDGRALGLAFSHVVATGSCTSTLCSYTTTGGDKAAMSRGEFAWTVVAATAGDDVEASNGAIFFSYDPNDIALMTNPGFETAVLTPWKATGATADKIKSGVGSGGGYGYQFKGSAAENSQIKQNSKVVYYGIKAGDVLTLSADYLAPKPTVNAKITVKIVYTAASGLPATKATLTATQTAVYVNATTDANVIGPVKKVLITVVHNSVNGKFTVDNLQVTLNGAP